MKLKFILSVFLLLFARGCDFYSTSLWIFEPDGLSHETNPLTQFFGVGWNGLVISNIVIITAIVIAFYYYTFRYKKVLPVSLSINNYKEYASLLYYEKKGKLYQLLYKIPSNKKAMFAHSGYVLLRVVIIGSLLASIHNLGQYYQLEFYTNFRQFVKRPLYVIYALILVSFFVTYRQLLIREFKLIRST